MAEEETAPLPPPPPAQPPAPAPAPAQPPLQPPVAPSVDPSPPPPKFDPSRMIGIIKRKALIKDLAAVYHAECLDYCHELLELQRKWEEAYANIKPSEDSRKDIARPSKRMKKSRREQA